jgi:TonB family protein
MVLRIRTRDDGIYGFAGERAALRACLIVSLAFHVCLIAGIQKAFPVRLFKPLRTYRVELVRPPVDEIDDEAAGTDLAEVKKQEKPPEKVEDTISLDTSDKRYVSYAKVIKERLNRHWRYPHEAYLNLMEGKVFVVFTLNREGRLLDANVLTSSGFKVLDHETIRAIRAASPFPPFPGSVSVKRLNVKANFAYKLTPRKK